jgi:flagella basal body P-ring formation protein FlgA
MIRLATAAVLLAFTASASAQQISPLASLSPQAPTLRGEVLATSDLVRIGDLVENAGAPASIAVFRAPDLGQTGSVSVARVVEALRPHNIIALDTRGLTEITVTRASRAIGTQEIEQRLAQIIASRYGLRNVDNLSVTFDREIRTLHIDPTASSDFNVVRMSFDPRSGRFDTVLEISGGTAASRIPMRFTGVAAETHEAAVVVRPIARGDVLRSSDIAIERRPKSEVHSDAVRDVQAAIGLAARQPLKAGQVVRRNDLAKPELVFRNEPVIMVFEQPGIMLTLRGKSLESGAEGDTVNVVNMQTKKTLQGTVIGHGRVAVASIMPRATTNIAAIAHPVAPARR